MTGSVLAIFSRSAGVKERRWGGKGERDEDTIVDETNGKVGGFEMEGREEMDDKG